MPLWMISAKVSPDSDLRGVKDGEWDIERRIDLATTAKHRAIREHFVDGRPWIETDLFRLNYAERLKREPIKHRTTLRELADLYDDKVGALYRSMKRIGFDRKVRQLPHVAIGRAGEILLTNQGNHRIAIAKILGIETVYCIVQCRHLSWILVRHSYPEHPDGRS